MSRFAGWADVAAHLERRTGNERVGEGHHRVPVTVREGSSDEHVCTLDVRVLAEDPTRISVSTVVGSSRYLPPLEVLHLNFLVAIGTVCLYRGECLLRHTMPLAGLHAHHLDEVIAGVADKSAVIKRRLAEG